ncbi:hypothetical protein BD779DRAFT_564181 [Infundibulicybe gibba]|nr:hypothetical protein BD779DRAFT_564181 [Infundibulicybe gibba]
MGRSESMWYYQYFRTAGPFLVIMQTVGVGAARPKPKPELKPETAQREPAGQDGAHEEVPGDRTSVETDGGRGNNVTPEPGATVSMQHPTASPIVTTAEDKAAAARITARNDLELYSNNLRNFIEDTKSKLETAVHHAIQWLDVSPESSKEEYEEKRKELEGIVDSIMQELGHKRG